MFIKRDEKFILSEAEGSPSIGSLKFKNTKESKYLNFLNIYEIG
jgi:hypothetical protein